MSLPMIGAQDIPCLLWTSCSLPTYTLNSLPVVGISRSYWLLRILVVQVFTSILSDVTTRGRDQDPSRAFDQIQT
jgi:hypothetical protein